MPLPLSLLESLCSALATYLLDRRSTEILAASKPETMSKRDKKDKSSKKERKEKKRKRDVDSSDDDRASKRMQKEVCAALTIEEVNGAMRFMLPLVTKLLTEHSTCRGLGRMEV